MLGELFICMHNNVWVVVFFVRPLSVVLLLRDGMLCTYLPSPLHLLWQSCSYVYFLSVQLTLSTIQRTNMFAYFQQPHTDEFSLFLFFIKKDEKKSCSFTKHIDIHIPYSLLLHLLPSRLLTHFIC